MLNGVRIWLIDTPGFDDTNRSDVEVLKDIAYWLAAAYSKHTQLAGILYLHSIKEPRFLGSAKRNLRMFQQICGTKNLDSVILATTHWSDAEGKRYPEDEGQSKVKELIETKEFWGEMITRGSRVERHDGTKESARTIISNLVDRKIRVVLDIQKQLVDQKKSLHDTDAGQALQSDIIEERKKSERKLADLRRDKELALEQKDLNWQKEIDYEKNKCEATIRRGNQQKKMLETNLKKMAAERKEEILALMERMNEERKQYQEAIKKSTKEIEEVSRKQRIMEGKLQEEREVNENESERVAAEHQEQLAMLEDRIRTETNRNLQAKLAQGKHEMEDRFARWHKQAKIDAEERRREGENRVEEVRRQQAHLKRSQENYRKEMEKRALESRKSRDLCLNTVIAVAEVIASGFNLARSL